MITYRTCIAALAMLAVAAQAHEFKPAEKIVLNCRSGWTPYMADVDFAVERSGYSATAAARRQMLTLTRKACAAGSIRVAFAPPVDRPHAEYGRPLVAKAQRAARAD